MPYYNRDPKRNHNLDDHQYIYIYKDIYIYMYTCVCTHMGGVHRAMSCNLTQDSWCLGEGNGKRKLLFKFRVEDLKTVRSRF